MRPWLVTALVLALALAPELAFAQDRPRRSREVFVRVQYDCFFEQDRQVDSPSRTVRDPRPGAPEVHSFFFTPPCQGRVGEVRLHEAEFGRALSPGERVFLPATYFEIGAFGCGDTSTCPGSLQVNVVLRNDSTADLEMLRVRAGKAGFHRNPEGGYRLRYFMPQSTQAVGKFDIEALITNNGPAQEEEAFIVLSLPEGVRLDTSRPPVWAALVSFAAGRCATAAGTVRCPVPEGQLRGIGAPPDVPGDAGFMYIPVIATQPTFQLRIRAAVLSDVTPDPRTDNNDGTGEVTVTSSPETTVEVRPDGAEGTATSFSDPRSEGFATDEVFRPFAARVSPRLRRLSRIRRVDIAVLRRTDEPGTCLWLANRRGQFRETEPSEGDCDQGRWLRARGTRRWRFRLTRRWPPGRYTLYSRAVNQAGVRETGFSRRERNLVKFTIRR